MASDPSFEQLADLRNEQALVYLAIQDFPRYQQLGAEPEDFFSHTNGRLVRIAEALHEVGPSGFSVTPSGHIDQLHDPLGAFLSFARERSMLSSAELDDAQTRYLDPPLVALADVERLRRMRVMRDTRAACLIAAKALEDGEPERASAVLTEAREVAERRRDSGSKTRSVRELLATWEAEANLRERGFSLGLRRLSHFVGDLHPGDVLVVGADTNVGKSTFVSECMFASADAGTKWGYISMEDSERRYTTRWIATLSGISTTALQRAEDRLVCTVEGRRAFDSYEGRIFAAALQGGTDQQVMAEMSVMARRGAQVIVVDYIGVVKCATREQDRRNEIREMFMRMKAHALRVGVALIIVSQLSRPKDKGEGYEPNKHDLKEAGDLENAADFVVLLWRPKEQDFAPVNVRLVKSKDGNTGNLWQMQREVFSEDRYGNRRPGSARLREVVKERKAPWSYDYPLLVEDYEAVLLQLRSRAS